MKADHRAPLLRRNVFAPGLFSVTFSAPDLAREIRPGQFVMLELPGLIRPYLRRAYSVADADPAEGTVELLVKTIGRGTGALEKLSLGAEAGLLGPLGNAFTFADLARGTRVAVVAGGIGAAPFPLLARGLRAAGLIGDLYLGGRSAADLALATRFAGAFDGETVLTTDDGSAGQRGRVTEAFERAAPARGYARAFACGPMAMFRSLAPLVARLKIASEFSTEADMGCGFGVCLGCVLPGIEKPFLISCTEGPILAPERIRW
ncbi:MAG TPA: dihydroorotate dehydrogenase electron transfer subunit [Thermoanaerobaculia bacterium]